MTRDQPITVFDAESRWHRALLLVVGVAIAVWGILGLIQRPRLGWGGYVYSPDYVVDGVEPGGPADRARLKVRDRVISVEGIPVEELPLYSRWPRWLNPRAGESRRVVVERDGEKVSVDIVYGARTVTMLHIGGAVIGLSFMGFGLWALFTVQSSHALALACMGLVAGIATLGGGGPYLGTWEGVASHIQFAAMVLWSLLMLRFFLTFPRPKPVSMGRFASWVIYGPWVLLLACLVLELIVHPTLYHTFGPVGSLLMLAYCILALAALTHTVVKTAGRELRESGMGLILVGILVGVAPTLLAALAVAFRLNLLGSDYYPLMLAALPLAMALAVRTHARWATRDLRQSAVVDRGGIDRGVR